MASYINSRENRVRTQRLRSYLLVAAAEAELIGDDHCQTSINELAEWIDQRYQIGAVKRKTCPDIS